MEQTEIPEQEVTMIYLVVKGSHVHRYTFYNINIFGTSFSSFHTLITENFHASLEVEAIQVCK